MIVFVHGVPETGLIWKKIRDVIGRESKALSMPGFGCPRPKGFAASKDAYIKWLIDELEQVNGPIDLVGHDWGALLTCRLAALAHPRLRSWIADVGNVIHSDYQWHDFARTWQTPGEGEEFFKNQIALPLGERAQVFEPLGVPAADARELASGVDATMGGCILDLYRSATPNPHHHWGPLAPTAAPGLILHPTDDPFSNARLAAEVADSLGARFVRMDGVGHFWPYQAPDQAATIFKTFWTSLRR
jgi:pimeloyl-ACP methyl ester carboxylesterase